MSFSILLLQLMVLLLLSGPLVPMLAVLFFRRASKLRLRGHRWALLGLTCLQALSFLPYWLASREVEDQGEALPYTIFPFLLGPILFLSTLVCAVAEYRRWRSIPMSHPPA